MVKRVDFWKEYCQQHKANRNPAGSEFALPNLEQELQKIADMPLEDLPAYTKRLLEKDTKQLLAKPDKPETTGDKKRKKARQQ